MRPPVKAYVWATVCKTVRLCYLTVACLSCPVCDVGALWPNGRWIKMPLGMEVGLDPGHIVLDVDQAAPKRAQLPIFSQCLLWPNGWMDQDDTW